MKIKMVTVTICCEGAAFEYDLAFEVSQILHDLADDLHDGVPREKSLIDTNGNQCGTVKLTRF